MATREMDVLRGLLLLWGLLKLPGPVVADSIALLAQDQGAPHFLRHGGGHCWLPTLWNTCTHVEPWNVHRGTCADTAGHRGHRDTYGTHGNTGHILTHRHACSNIHGLPFGILALLLFSQAQIFPSLFKK